MDVNACSWCVAAAESRGTPCCCIRAMTWHGSIVAADRRLKVVRFCSIGLWWWWYLCVLVAYTSFFVEISICIEILKFSFLNIIFSNKITVITKKFVTSDSKLSHHGDIIYASIQTQGNEYKIYKYSPF